MSFFHNWIKEHIDDKPSMKKGNLEYVRAQLKYIDQVELIEMLKQMNLKELRYVMGAGIHGSANGICIDLIRQRQKEQQAYLARQPLKKIDEVPYEKDHMLTTAPSLQKGSKQKDETIKEDLNNVTVSAEDTKNWEYSTPEHVGYVKPKKTTKENK